MRKRSYAIPFIALLAACPAEDAEDGPPEGAPPATADTVGVASADLEAQLPLLLTSSISVAGSSEDIGTVRLLQSGEADGALMVTIEVNDAKPGRHGWEIRDGDCAAMTDSSATSPASRTTGVTGNIDVGAAGFGEASALIPASAVEAGEVGRSLYSLVVSEIQSPEGSRAIACADL